MPKKQLTEAQMRAIDNYSDDITTMKDFVSVTRRRPGYQIGGIGNRGYKNMIREIFQNAIDQLMDPTSPCDFISLYYNMRTLEVEVTDNGKGFPFKDMVRMLTKEYTSKNYVKRKGEYSSGMHGAGAKIVNALSETMIVESYLYTGEAARLEMHKGYPTTKEPKKIPNKEKRQGSIVRFVPDLDIMGQVSLDWKVVYNLIKHIMSITPIGSRMEFCAVDEDGVEHKESIINEDGIITDLIMKVKNPIIAPITVFMDDGEHRLELAFTYDGGDDKNPPLSDVQVTAFSNFCETVDGTHISGSVDGIVRWFVKYMNNIFLNNSKSKLSITSSDIKTGLNMMIAAAHLEPIFGSQSKDILTNEDMVPFCRQVVMAGLDEWSKINPNDLAKVCKYFKEVGEARLKNDKEKLKITAKYKSNSLSGLPSKFARPTEVCKEFIIVEGDSAGGSAKVGRDEKCQGIFPIRGKIPSAYEKTKNEFWDNAETQGIAKIILGREYYRTFDPFKDVKWEKIIFMADADVDGAHIASLLLRYFILYMPQLVQAGKVYKAIPPLYSIKNGKKIQYFTNQYDFVKCVEKDFCAKNKVSYAKSKDNLTMKELTNLFVVNEDYVYELESLAKTFGVEPLLLESALFGYINETSLPALRKRLKHDFRFMNVDQINGNIVYDGTIKESNFLVRNERLISNCKRILPIIKKNREFYYNLNGNEVSIYGIMKAFDDSTPNGIQRYKGLGEMNPSQLSESTLRPDSPRTLIQYTLEDMKEELAFIREHEADRSKLLDYVGNVKRSDLLD